jgi:hypothetical protein
MQRALGLVLFLPVPVVLLLFTRQPLGTVSSLVLGVVLTLTHRLYARPFALARASRRCLWCGGEARAEAVSLALDEPLGRTEWRACTAAHRERLARTLAWAADHRRFLAVGILGTLALFLASAAAAAFGAASPRLQPADAVAVLHLGVALTVLPFGWLAPTQGAAAGPASRLPFPVHVQALVGTAWVLWLFRLVGVWWLAAGLLHVVRRLAG